MALAHMLVVAWCATRVAAATSNVTLEARLETIHLFRGNVSKNESVATNATKAAANATTVAANVTKTAANATKAIGVLKARNNETDDVVVAVREFETNLEALSVEDAPIAEAELSRRGHWFAAKELQRLASTGSPHWSLLGSLSRAFERARAKNAQRISSFLAVVSNATVEAMHRSDRSDDDPSGSEERLVAAWRTRVNDYGDTEGLDLGVAEADFRSSLRAGALRAAYARLAERRVEAELQKLELPVTNATLDQAGLVATETAAVELASAWNATLSDDARSLALSAWERSKAWWTEANNAAVADLGTAAIAAAAAALDQCLAGTPIEAKLGLGHPAAARVCEADASLEWYELEEARPLVRLFREQRRQAASSTLRAYRDRAKSISDGIHSALLNATAVSDATLSAAVDKCRANIPMDDVRPCVKPIRARVDDAVKRALDVVLKHHLDASAGVDAVVDSLARPRYALCDGLLAKLIDDNARASSDCMRAAVADAAKRLADPQASIRPRPKCKGPAAADPAYVGELERLHDLLRNSRPTSAPQLVTKTNAAYVSAALAALQFAVLVVCGCKSKRAFAVRAPVASACLTCALLIALALGLAALALRHVRGDDDSDVWTFSNTGHVAAAALALILKSCCGPRRRRARTNLLKRYHDDHEH